MLLLEWLNTGSMKNAREAHTSSVLTNGKVLISGGYADMSVYLSNCELYDPSTETWTTTGRMN